MQTIEVRFKFDGNLAETRHGLDASDGNSFHEGVRQLLALHAFFLTNADVPRRGVINHTAQYQVIEAGASSGSIEFTYYVDLFVEAALMAAGGKFGLLTFEQLFETSITQMLGRLRRSIGPLFRSRDENLLCYNDGNMKPFVDLDDEAYARWDRFIGCATPRLLSTLHPLGRSAENLTIRAGHTTPVLISAQDIERLIANRRIVQELAITEAVRMHNDRSNGFNGDPRWQS